MLAAPSLAVARAVAPGAAQNACNTTEVLVDRIEICYRNVTFAEQPAPEDPAADPTAEPPVAHRGLVPLDTDAVRLFAIVWAREPDEPEFRPFCGDAGFDNDGSYWRCGEISGSPKFNHNAQHFFEVMQREQLDPAIRRVEAWPWPCHTLRFDWQELVVRGDSHKDEAGKSVRSYAYDEPAELEVLEPGEEAHGWIVTPLARPGTRRFRAQVSLPEGVWNRRTRRKHRKPGATLVTRRANGSLGYRRGFSLRLSVRAAAVPRARTAELTEMLRWATAFIGTPYENGGHWLGGRAGANVSQGGNGVYGGHGFDCNGFIEACADLAGIEWAVRKKSRHGTMYKYRRGDAGSAFPGVEVPSGDDLSPGDLLDLKSSSHVALVYDRFVDSDGRGRIRIIDCSGSRQGVSIHAVSNGTSTIGDVWELVDMSDPQKRPWKT